MSRNESARFESGMRFQSCSLRTQTCSLTRVSMRAVYSLPVAAICLSVLGLGWSSYAFVSLQSGPAPLVWSNTTIGYVINQQGDPRISDGSEETAVRMAFQAWEQVSSSRLAFIEDQSPASRARTDWRSDDVHLVVWDMTNESGFFEGAAGLVAITPVDFDPATGAILDADIIFNGKNYNFSTDLTGGTFDVQNVATHEIGHFVGLDHSAVVGATMNPFANTQDTRLRSLERDDVSGASAIYPVAGFPGAISGQIVRQNGTPVSGAHVVAEDLDGNPVSATLSDGAGNFAIRGLDQGQYVIYAEPLDGPVRSNNFSLHTSGLVIDTDFGTTFFGAASGQSSPGNPDRVMVTFGQVSQLPRTLVARPRLGSPMNITSSNVLTIAPGGATQLQVFGSGLSQANRILIPGDGVFLSNETFTASAARADMEVLGSALTQLRTVRVWNASTGDCAVLTGGFEIRRAAPLLEGLDPATAAPGTTVNAFGSNIAVGARVVVGGTVVNGSMVSGGIAFTLPALPNGTYSVAVENPDGQFAKLKDALVVAGSTASAPPPPPTSGSGSAAPAPAAATGAPAAQGAAPTAPSGETGGSFPIGGGGGGGGGGGCAVSAAPASGSGFPLLVLLAFTLWLLRGQAKVAPVRVR